MVVVKVLLLLLRLLLRLVLEVLLLKEVAIVILIGLRARERSCSVLVILIECLRRIVAIEACH
jgi:hypothetical protein